MTGDLTTVLGDSFGTFGFPAMAPWVDLWDAWRSFFVFSSIIFWVFLLQGIIQGQIIDSFAEMRQSANFALQDLEANCFISSIPRFKFARHPEEWEARRKGRYAWNYVYFLSHLRNKDPDEYNGNENLVASQFDAHRYDFLPVGIALGLYGERISEEEEDQGKLNRQTEEWRARIEQQIQNLTERTDEQFVKLNDGITTTKDMCQRMVSNLQNVNSANPSQNPFVRRSSSTNVMAIRDP
eukprot:CAMPEP_0184298334 /NCGR_PEP_ID=MMETSP1049-20130417/9164_1 /TAXON_ID=77928 /ORGANISM="Proteomonas sulcata, Strain CCMP704" /LENGTH=238 /DNA_ID=CAMNT_0026608437 /DNA_START=68 /DNA_END=784 /DNA_ORIENTATION=+